MTVSLSSVRTGRSDCRSPKRRPPLLMAFTVWKERRALARMDIKRLTDLGISPRDAAIESARPIWDLPADRCG